MLARAAAAALTGFSFFALAACGAPPVRAPAPPSTEQRAEAVCTPPRYPEESTFFASAEVEDATSIDVPSNGDLWASCASGDALYTAWGDGFGFAAERAGPRPDIGVGVVHGAPGDPAGVQGTNLVTDRHKTQSVFKVFTPGPYYQKPTGMLCRGKALYLAVQDLNEGYDDAPAATIAESTDGGATWKEDATPMFTGAVFTTIMFLDDGPDGRDARDGYVYAYGIDFDFRGSDHAPSPHALYLARIANGRSPRDRSAWEFYAGGSWTKHIGAKTPVLVDCTRRHTAETHGEPVIGQGSVVYDAPLGRYLYTSWSEHTFELYEAPAPWGPWRHFLSKDFGMPPWTEKKHGGYATTAPSLWMSGDGRTLWIQANTWSAGVDHNDMALRKLVLVPR